MHAPFDPPPAARRCDRPDPPEARGLGGSRNVRLLDGVRGGEARASALAAETFPTVAGPGSCSRWCWAAPWPQKHTHRATHGYARCVIHLHDSMGKLVRRSSAPHRSSTIRCALLSARIKTFGSYVIFRPFHSRLISFCADGFAISGPYRLEVDRLLSAISGFFSPGPQVLMC
jgi:hypothetical protein